MCIMPIKDYICGHTADTGWIEPCPQRQRQIEEAKLPGRTLAWKSCSTKWEIRKVGVVCGECKVNSMGRGGWKGKDNGYGS